MKSLFVAVQFLTRLPLPSRGTITVPELGRSMRWFPVVGALIGFVVGLVAMGLASLVAPSVHSAALVILLIAITGGLHLDGLMDTCDAIFAFTSPGRRLEIMRDSRVGSFAVVGAATLLILKYAAFLSIPTQHLLPAFVAIGAISRWSMVFATVRFPSARTMGLGHDFKEAAGRTELVLATITAVILASLSGTAGIAALLLAGAATALIARYTISKIAGLTGDIYGAVCEATEVLVAVVLPPLWRAFVP